MHSLRCNILLPLQTHMKPKSLLWESFIAFDEENNVLTGSKVTQAKWWLAGGGVVGKGCLPVGSTLRDTALSSLSYHRRWGGGIPFF